VHPWVEWARRLWETLVPRKESSWCFSSDGRVAGLKTLHRVGGERRNSGLGRGRGWGWSGVCEQRRSAAAC
jgi:hypothetical protein